MLEVEKHEQSSLHVRENMMLAAQRLLRQKHIPLFQERLKIAAC